MVNVESVEQFTDIIRDKTTIVDFFAQWCNPCKMLAPVFEKTSELHPEVNFVKVDVDDMRSLAIAYDVTAVPTLIMFKNGKIVDKKAGFLPQSRLEDWIKISGHA
jgi:thioredoxin 1